MGMPGPSGGFSPSRLEISNPWGLLQKDLRKEGWLDAHLEIEWSKS